MGDDSITAKITEWYDHYSDSIFHYILMMVHDYQQAEDLTHDTYLKAYKNYSSFEERVR
ncbi:RNA polymerase sigma factor [Oceanobacillus longus]|uniref:RNA polymerase sigma factor n=1 Tax=Oceanobacillus longus TaxID=930120 RepID=A0ABV8H3Q4_9BACI